MKVIKPPQNQVWEEDGGSVVFLAGSIEMGRAEKWQDRFIKEFVGIRGVILNPRRDDWDSSWKQEIDNPQFREQVEWELRGLERASIVAMYFDPDTKSPITLLELGLIVRDKPTRLIVYCPEGFYRKGNVDIICRKYKITNCISWQDFVNEVKQNLW